VRFVGRGVAVPVVGETVINGLPKVDAVKGTEPNELVSPTVTDGVFPLGW
jgi:hypothetical protein